MFRHSMNAIIRESFISGKVVFFEQVLNVSHSLTHNLKSENTNFKLCASEWHKFDLYKDCLTMALKSDATCTTLCVYCVHISGQVRLG